MRLHMGRIGGFSIKMKKILFICLGNICRSCTAEEVFRTMAQRQGAGEKFVVDSAGLIDYHEGELPDHRMRRAAADKGYRLTHHSRPIRSTDFTAFDLIVAMDMNNRQRLERLAPNNEAAAKIVMMADYLSHHPAFTHIPDPYYGNESDFALTVELLEDACSGLLSTLLSE